MAREHIGARLEIADEWAFVYGHHTDTEFLALLADEYLTCDPSAIQREWGRWVPNPPGSEYPLQWYQAEGPGRGASRLTWVQDSDLRDAD